MSKASKTAQIPLWLSPLPAQNTINTIEEFLLRQLPNKIQQKSLIKGCCLFIQRYSQYSSLKMNSVALLFRIQILKLCLIAVTISQGNFLAGGWKMTLVLSVLPDCGSSISSHSWITTRTIHNQHMLFTPKIMLLHTWGSWQILPYKIVVHTEGARFGHSLTAAMDVDSSHVQLQDDTSSSPGLMWRRVGGGGSLQCQLSPEQLELCLLLMTPQF